MVWRVGIDENGLGPQLGPLIVTAAMARVTDGGEKRLREDPASFLHERLADSKALVSHRHAELGEAWARAVAQSCHDAVPQNPDELLENLSLSDRASLQAPCPTSAKPQCWHTEGEKFLASDAQVATARSDLQRLSEAGIEVRWVQTQITCVRRLNDAREAGRGRLDEDLRSMEELLLCARDHAEHDIVAVCGKVGGLQRYIPRFTLLNRFLVATLQENRACSRYHFPKLGEVAFTRDADGADPLVALASLVGKSVREILMKRIVRYYRSADPSLPDASGYNDVVTDRFVRDTEEPRREREIPNSCFLRDKAPGGR